MATATVHATKTMMESNEQSRRSERRGYAIGNEIAWRPGEPTDYTQIEPPVIKIPQLVNFLRDMDVDRCPGWQPWLKDIEEYVEYVDRLRHRIRDQPPEDTGLRPGEDLFPEVLDPMLKDAKLFLGLHKNFEDWNYGRTPWSNDRRPDSFVLERLPIHKRLKGRRTQLIPRPQVTQHTPFRLLPIPPTGTPDYVKYFQSADGQLNKEVIDSLRLHEDAYWRAQADTAAAADAAGSNLFAIENETYERCVQGGFPELISNPPSGTDPTDLRFQAVHRGWRRAATQRCLNLLANTKNKELITPWMRVVLPELPRKMKEIVFEPLALVQEDPTVHEPSPWIYWYNQYLEQTTYRSAWARRAFHKKHWNDYRQVALPINYQGPYVFDDKCVFDDHWLKLSKSISQLSKRLSNAAVTRGVRGEGRKFLEQIVKDVSMGLTQREKPPGIVPRYDGDRVKGQPDEFQLVDEKDMEWLKFLCEPAANPDFFTDIVSKRVQPDNALFTLFDHRIQTLFNDTLVATPDAKFANRFWKFIENSDKEGEGFPRVMSLSIPLQELLDIVNRGGRDLVKVSETTLWKAVDLNDETENPPNEMYQFSLEQAQRYCIELATLGRLCYECPYDVLDPEQPIATSYHSTNHLFATRRQSPSDHGRVGLRVYEIYPELRVRWRYEHFSQRDSANAELLAALDVPGAEKEKDSFVPETLCKPGWYDENGDEERRGTPSWADLASPREVLDKKYKKPSSRTVNFFRVLAWRMGRTMRYCRQLEVHTNRRSGLTRGDLDAALREWDEAVASFDGSQNQPDSASSSASAPSTLQAVVKRADKRPFLDYSPFSLSSSEAFEQIRLGLIEDAVQNRTMLYPSRRVTYTDAQGNVHEALERTSIWAWAHPDIRKFHRIRTKYFDMRRWPLNRQSAETERRIRRREDERQPEQMYWMQPALERYGGQKTGTAQTKHGRGMFNPRIEELDSEQKRENAAKMIDKFSNQAVSLMKESKKVDENWGVNIAPPSRSEARLTKAVSKPRNETFIQGPPVFPMGDTVLKQLMMSQELQNVLYPPNPPTLLNRATSLLTTKLLPPPSKTPLLPPLPDANRVPSSHPTKRKASSFLAEVPPPKKRVVLGRDGSARIIDVQSGWEVDRAAGPRGGDGRRDRGREVRGGVEETGVLGVRRRHMRREDADGGREEEVAAGYPPNAIPSTASGAMPRVVESEGEGEEEEEDPEEDGGEERISGLRRLWRQTFGRRGVDENQHR